MASKPWKAFERRVAHALDGRRISVAESLSQGKDKGDIDHPLFVIECKKRKALRIPEWWRQAKNESQGTGKFPLLCVSSPKLERPLVIMSLKDFTRMYHKYIKEY